MLTPDQLKNGRLEEFLHLLVGEMLGEGEFRTVYALRNSPDLVIKIEKGTPFCNISEWQLWEAVQRFDGGKWARWFAPCEALSYGGRIMLQKRCEPLATPPKLTPDVISDDKAIHWMQYKGRPVCVDYAWNNVHKVALASTKLHAPKEPRNRGTFSRQFTGKRFDEK